ncbi:MAG: hypothetical protein H6Q90_2435 [Deltaproteobacteria bacterium]|nr:hypothetical protein [Deltaproteobacteria bacterium]
MGSPTSEPCRNADETQHQVTLTRGFEIQSTEVTQAFFLDIMGYNPSGFSGCGATCPVEVVNWHEGAAYCNQLSIQNGLTSCYACTGSGPSVSCSETVATAGSAIYACAGYRLPTEAEWEYAYRAATSTSYYSGPNNGGTCGIQPNGDLIGWYNNTANSPRAVQELQPNAWGLFDMAGNVWEWCHDPPQGDLGASAVVDPVGVGGATNRILRGGSWFEDAISMRAANRISMTSTLRGGADGFRCVRTLAP